MGAVYSQKTRVLEMKNPGDSPSNSKTKFVYLDSCPSPTCDECSSPSDSEPESPGTESCADYWQRRMQELAQSHAVIDTTLSSEYDRARAEIKPRPRDESSGSGPAPCAQAGQEMLECLKQCGARELDCAAKLQNFSSCVDQHRLAKLRAREGASPE